MEDEKPYTPNPFYTPKLISIGPVHYNNDKLKDMQEMKKGYLELFFHRTCKPREEFECIIKKNNDKIRSCYAPDISLPTDFVEMILLDSIFIIELFLRNEYEEDERDYILSKPWLKDGILKDLILLENQLPLFILNHLYDQSRCKGIYNSFLTLACNYFFERKKSSPEDKLSIDEMKGVKHFTDLYRHFYRPPNSKYIGEKIIERQTTTKLDATGLIFEKWDPHGQKKDEKYSLQEQRSLLRVKFKKSCCPRINCSWPAAWLKKFPSLKRSQIRLVIPEFVVDDGTEELFRNLMALEQCHYPNEAYICNYIKLLDSLINDREDVLLLVDKGIIVNSLGSNKEAAKLINSLGHGIVENTFYYGKVAKDLNDYYKSDWNKNMATLKNVYFRDIWRTTATVVGSVVLLITLLNFLRPFVFPNT